MSDSHCLSGLGVRDLGLGFRVQCRVEVVLGFGLPLFPGPDGGRPWWFLLGSY